MVEDELSLLDLLATIIEEQGHTALRASNGQQALALIEQEQPRLVISDVMMPVMDGYRLLENIRLRDEWQNIKVVLISAAPINKERHPPADAYASKPYDLEGIEALVENLTAGQ